MKKLIRLLFGIVILFAISSCTDNKHAKNYNTVVDKGGSVFIIQGLEAGLAEIKAAKLAEVNSKNPRIINFAKMMIADHTQTGDELEKIGINKGITEGDTINAEHQKLIDNISTKKGADFDKAYIQMMVTDHESVIKLFAGAAGNKSADIQNFAKKTLPALKMHLDSANAICAALK
ncbi:DUF4142 domain-containing protein [Mucilaginibacter sp.]|uniref:DUF4142 domain-containing protein n=1 Tax=Mucilaginibacter sp. TaxID=1882438 RepID=UPI002624926A|nr:DUF4142 domain-containing protein [Mucilaginibacter sp.]MDB4924277.1 hypothetical protein [Mucilaginibacter sp.]